MKPDNHSHVSRVDACMPEPGSGARCKVVLVDGREFVGRVVAKECRLSFDYCGGWLELETDDGDRRINYDDVQSVALEIVNA